MNIYSIYKATNKFDGKCYIGFATNFKKRVTRHKTDSKTKNNKFYYSIRKYGWDNFVWEVLYQSKDKIHTLKVMENFFIVQYDSYTNGYNETLGGEGTLGRTYKHKEISKQKMSISRKGKSPWNKGKTGIYSEKFLKQKSEKTIFRTLKRTKTHNENISKSLTSRKLSKEHSFAAAFARSKEYKMLNPAGKIINIKNMSEYCRVNHLNQSHMISVYLGRYGFISHKGYKKIIED
jgi:group I intron endonuclease